MTFEDAQYIICMRMDFNSGKIDMSDLVPNFEIYKLAVEKIKTYDFTSGKCKCGDKETTDSKEYLIKSLHRRGLISENDKYKLLLEIRKEKCDSGYCVCSEPTTHSMGALPPNYKRVVTICDVCGLFIKGETENKCNGCNCSVCTCDNKEPEEGIVPLCNGCTDFPEGKVGCTCEMCLYGRYNARKERDKEPEILGKQLTFNEAREIVVAYEQVYLPTHLKETKLTPTLAEYKYAYLFIDGTLVCNKVDKCNYTLCRICKDAK